MATSEDEQTAYRRWGSSLRRAADALSDLLGHGRPDPQEATTGPAGPAPDRDRFTYSPVDDGHADPGEVVWAWVPFEENARKGKDRPVLIVGRDGEHLLALQLTSKDHDRDADQEAEAGRFWMDIGTGAWDRYRRPSEVRVNRLIRLDESAVRRTGDRLDRDLFDRVIAEVRRFQPPA